MDWAQAAIVIVSIIIALALLMDSIINQKDIGTGWLSLLGLVWGAVLGVREVVKRLTKKAHDSLTKKEGDKNA